MSFARRAFSFTEVLFAVMILGIGFIMVAAMFPVAIQQAKNSTEEGTGAAVSRAAANYIEKAANNVTMPPTYGVVVTGDWDPDGQPSQPVFNLSNALRGGLVLPSDSRVGWIPFYKRSGNPDDPATVWPPYAQVFMIPVYVRSQSEFSPQQGPLVLQRLAPQKQRGMPIIRANIFNGQNGAADTITFTGDNNSAVEGAYVIIADARRGTDPTTDWNRIVAPDLQGRIYRLGNRATNTGTTTQASAWELMPGFDFEPLRYDMDEDPATTNHPDPRVRDGKETTVPSSPTSPLSDVLVFVVGRGFIPTGTAVEGGAQDVGAYTTFVNVN